MTRAFRTPAALRAAAGLALAASAAALAAAPAPAAGAERVRAADPVLVIGGFDARQDRLDGLAAALTARGHPAETMQLLGDPAGTAPIAESAHAVAVRAAGLLARTGAARVDVVGHSMGGLAQRHYLKFLGGASRVGTAVSVGTPEQGEVLGLLCAVASPGCRDLLPDSAFLKRLNAAPAVPPGPRAYHLYSEQGLGEKAALPGAVNAAVQEFCPGRRVGHAGEPVDAAMQDLVVAALEGRPLAAGCAG
ncbi:esterase/lipase family protein [Actinomadura parmotrematis]|uniref:Alpha/beta hydrolase n=1 Tax=Actinomadura parmotrematis TaxID=2864039 RepID=A0ABS7FWD1_9ACTN|nr:alpha/beta hydrolase [Actinomadura parmotrematis]MBW8484738.1 alpha/beta hydrolase [Actinomadura parmotrematis]